MSGMRATQEKLTAGQQIARDGKAFRAAILNEVSYPFAMQPEVLGRVGLFDTRATINNGGQPQILCSLASPAEARGWGQPLKYQVLIVTLVLLFFGA